MMYDWVFRTKLPVEAMRDGLRKTRQDSRPLIPVGAQKEDKIVIYP